LSQINSIQALPIFTILFELKGKMKSRYPLALFYVIFTLCIAFVLGVEEGHHNQATLIDARLGRPKIQNLQKAIHAQDLESMKKILDDPLLQSPFLTLDIQNTLKSIQSLDTSNSAKNTLYSTFFSSHWFHQIEILQIKLAQDLVQHFSLHSGFHQAFALFLKNEYLILQVHPDVWKQIVLNCVSPDRISLFPILSSNPYLVKLIFPSVLQDAFKLALDRLSNQDIVTYFFKDPHLSGHLKVKSILISLLLSSSKNNPDLLNALLRERRVIERVHHLDLRTLIKISKHEIFSIPEEVVPTLKELHRTSRNEAQKWRTSWSRFVGRIRDCRGSCFRAPKVIFRR
jgi:hypothetical protein